MKDKKLVTVLVAIIVLLLIGGAYMFGRKPNNEEVYSVPDNYESSGHKGEYPNDSVNKEESVDEIFNNQPGEIKSIKAEGNNKWILEIDLLSHNSKWLPGNDSNGGFFINQNTKIRNLDVTENTKTYECGFGPDNNITSADVLINTSDYINKIQSSEYKIRFFDINGTNITVIYEQCLP